jgi:hypothetical protein
MWWEPRTDQESRVASAIAQLKSWFGEISSDTAPVAWGFGSTWTADGTLVPLALLNSDRFSTMPPFRLFDRSRITEPLEGTYFPPTSSAPLHVMFVTPPRPSSGALSLQEQMSLVDGVFNDFVRIRERIVGNPQGAPGTAAVLVRDRATGRHGVLTAGHIFPGGQGSRVDRLDTWYYFFWDRRQIGQLIHHEVPVPNAAGWDAAVIELSNAVQPRGRLAARGVERFEEPEAVVVHGAITDSFRMPPCRAPSPRSNTIRTAAGGRIAG